MKQGKVNVFFSAELSFEKFGPPYFTTSKLIYKYVGTYV